MVFRAVLAMEYGVHLLSESTSKIITDFLILVEVMSRANIEPLSVTGLNLVLMVRMHGRVTFMLIAQLSEVFFEMVLCAVLAMEYGVHLLSEFTLNFVTAFLKFVEVIPRSSSEPLPVTGSYLVSMVLSFSF